MHKARVLLVEDDPDIATVCQLGFDPARYTLAWADTLAAARAMLSASSLPDAIVLDVGLPDGDGLMLCWEVKALRPRLPVIVITASGQPRVERDAQAAGADRFVRKPFDLDELCATVEALVTPGAA